MKKTLVILILFAGCANRISQNPNVRSYEGNTSIEYEYKDRIFSRSNLQKLDNCVYLGMVNMNSNKIPKYKCKEIK